jgi:hypothetical protein
MYEELIETRRQVFALEARIIEQDEVIIQQEMQLQTNDTRIRFLEEKVDAFLVQQERIFKMIEDISSRGTICEREFDSEIKMYRCYFTDPMQFMDFEGLPRALFEGSPLRQNSLSISNLKGSHPEIKSFKVYFKIQTLVRIVISNTDTVPELVRSWHKQRWKDNGTRYTRYSKEFEGGEHIKINTSTEGLVVKNQSYGIQGIQMDYEFKPFTIESIFSQEHVDHLTC